MYISDRSGLADVDAMGTGGMDADDLELAMMSSSVVMGMQTSPYEADEPK